MPTTRSIHNPIIHPGSDPSILGNINGPSLIRVPDWVGDPLGQNYLYFAHHQGEFIRMAYADEVMGPYRVYSPGVLQKTETLFQRHIASPDIHVDHDNRVIRMFYHGAGFTGPKHENFSQNSCHAQSSDGLSFICDKVCLGPPYLRLWKYDEMFYGFAGGGSRDFWRTEVFCTPFERGPALPIEGEPYSDNPPTVEVGQNPDSLPHRMRHTGLDLRGHELDIYYSNVGDHPERIRRTTISLSREWTWWRGSPPVEVLRTETDYEGANEPCLPSMGGASHEPVHQLRDPFIFNKDGGKYLVYSVAGEMGLGITELNQCG